MKCPHCQTDFFANWLSSFLECHSSSIVKGGKFDGNSFYPKSTIATCPTCNGPTILVTLESKVNDVIFVSNQVYPRGGRFPSAPPEVPQIISDDYAEANEVLTISPKASAALSRRCLQSILSSHGYTGRDLVKQVEAAINEADASKSLPTALKQNVDAIRNFGNFSAHPITDQTTLQIVEVEEGEAEWCLQLLLDLFDHYYVAPARASERRAALAEKLSAAGKPPMKG